jgi:hypothetical protein
MLMTYKKEKMMKRKILLLTLMLGLIFSHTGLWQAQGASSAKPSVPKGWKFSFPDGDHNAGRTVFMKMECYACHDVKLRRESLAKSGDIGPDLSGYSALPKEYLAESIIRDAHRRRCSRLHGQRREGWNGELQPLHDDPGDDRSGGFSEARD